ncbi:hypothetical protein MRB53_023753 [Persea americana]|uniref:Uncharacterized protein n=1 Tax=Persea americana TaxID=3435 RepID=A0ACC2LAQ8_PERAE|nr:hypothetical protein MRB53_023753 [Persea americana]
MPEVATIARACSSTRIASSSCQPDQVLTPRMDGSSVALASGEASSCVRGKTRGLKVEKLKRQLGHASQFQSQLRALRQMANLPLVLQRFSGKRFEMKHLFGKKARRLFLRGSRSWW